MNIVDLAGFFEGLKVAGFPLLLVLIGSVQVIKGLAGTNGKKTQLVAVIVGTVLGIGYWFTANGAPVGLSGWFTALLFGWCLGIVGFGLFDFGVDVESAGTTKG